MQPLLDTRAMCSKVVFPKNGSTGQFTIARFRNLTPDGPYEFSLKGEFYAEEGKQYEVQAQFVEKNASYGTYDYEAIRVGVKQKLELSDPVSVKRFLMAVYGAKTGAKLLTLKNPIEVLNAQDVDTIKTLKGVGTSYAETYIRMYTSSVGYMPLYEALKGIDLEAKHLNAIKKHSNNVQEAVALAKSIQSNLYVLATIPNIPFRDVDALAKKSMYAETDPRRLTQIIETYFKKRVELGHTWVHVQTMFNDLLGNGGFRMDMDCFAYDASPNDSMVALIKLMQHHPDFLLFDQKSNTDYKLATRKWLRMEKELASELSRLHTANDTLQVTDLDLQYAMDWYKRERGSDFGSKQKEALRKMNASNLYLLQGGPGTGKTECLLGYHKAVKHYNPTKKLIGSALSGKAAENLQSKTNIYSGTLDRLMLADESAIKSASIVVIDEISMVDCNRLLDFLKVVKTGTKVIMIGDVAQLDAIGVGVLNAFNACDWIEGSVLDENFRQKSGSHIPVHAEYVRKGLVPPEILAEPIESGSFTYGLKQDMQYHFADTRSNMDQLLADYSSVIASGLPIQEIAVLCGTNNTVAYFNKELKKQFFPNGKPAATSSIEIGSYQAKDFVWAGCRVLNKKNHYNLETEFSKEPVDIFNGYLGTVVDVNLAKESVSVLFDNLEEQVVLSGSEIDDLQLGYAMTVHKAQGATVHSAFVYQPQNRQLLYTAMTRASKETRIYYDKTRFKQAVLDAGEEKCTFLEAYLKNESV